MRQITGGAGMNERADIQRGDGAPAKLTGGRDVSRLGPVLVFRGFDGDRARIGVLLVRPSAGPAPVVATDDGPVEPGVIASSRGRTIYSVALSLPLTPDTGFSVDGRRHPVRTDYEGDLRILFTSCNGMEDGDLDRADRNAVWDMALQDHRDHPFRLHLMGGDQIYADEVTKHHPDAEAWPDSVPDHLTNADVPRLRADLFDLFADRYIAVYAQGPFATLAAQIPTLSMWDDHDICDGWGSLSPELLDSPVGQALFGAARDAFLVFQCAVAADGAPPLATDPTGDNLSFHALLPGLAILAPDLRSERRPGRVMADTGWRAYEAMLNAADRPRAFLMSSVPAIGPRLSIVERAMNMLPGEQGYEDDLRDQWQSFKHRGEWRRFLQGMIDWQDRTGGRITALSGEIHLAAHGVMGKGDVAIRQLVSSGIAHPPPPRAWALTLALLSRLGDSPVPGHPIRLRSVPGHGRYVADRNYLTLERRDGAWQAQWVFERTGPTRPIAI